MIVIHEASFQQVACDACDTEVGVGNKECHEAKQFPTVRQHWPTASLNILAVPQQNR